MRKQIMAVFAALFITGIVAMAIATIGANAMLNKNGTVVSNSPVNSANASAPSSSTQATIADLQKQIAVYQAREQQYQAALQSDNQQLAQTSQEIQTIQQLLVYLQNNGLIRINSQGQIFVTNGH